MVPLGRSFYDFLFEHPDDFSRIWTAGTVSLQPGLLRLSQWTKDFNHYSHTQTHTSIWIRLVALPQEHWRERTLKEIASVVDTPISIDGQTRNRAFGYYTRILVDIDLSKRVYDEILVEREGFAFNVEVQYERCPLFCHHCYVIEHNEMNCKRLNPKAAKIPDCGKKQVTDAKAPTRVGNGASFSGTLRYVQVVPHQQLPPLQRHTLLFPHQQLPSPMIIQQLLPPSHQLSPPMKLSPTTTQQVPLPTICKIFQNQFLKVIYLSLLYLSWN